MDGWMIVKWMDGYIINTQLDGWMIVGWMEGQMVGWINGWTDKQLDGSYLKKIIYGLMMGTLR